MVHPQVVVDILEGKQQPVDKLVADTHDVGMLQPADVAEGFEHPADVAVAADIVAVGRLYIDFPDRVHDSSGWR